MAWTLATYYSGWRHDQGTSVSSNPQLSPERRHQADMAMVHRIVHGQSGLDPETWFEMAGARRNTRSAADPLTILVKTGRLDVKRQFFSIRVIEGWNEIPPDVKGEEKAEHFRARYKKLRA